MIAKRNKLNTGRRESKWTSVGVDSYELTNFDLFREALIPHFKLHMVPRDLSIPEQVLCRNQ